MKFGIADITVFIIYFYSQRIPSRHLGPEKLGNLLNQAHKASFLSLRLRGSYLRPSALIRPCLQAPLTRLQYCLLGFRSLPFLPDSFTEEILAVFT